MSNKSARPISPHLDIYRLPLTALLSISHRITGVINAVGAVFLVLVLLSAANGSGGFGLTGAILQSWFGKLVLFGFTLTLYFHFCNGIRHLAWDMGKGFELDEAEKSGRFVLIAAGILTLITWLVAIAAN